MNQKREVDTKTAQLFLCEEAAKGEEKGEEDELEGNEKAGEKPQQEEASRETSRASSGLLGDFILSLCLYLCLSFSFSLSLFCPDLGGGFAVCFYFFFFSPLLFINVFDLPPELLLLLFRLRLFYSLSALFVLIFRVLDIFLYLSISSSSCSQRK